MNCRIGAIPPEIGKLSNLASFIVSDNQLSGSIPDEFVNMKAIQKLDLSNNDFTGTFPNADWQFLKEFIARRCSFSAIGSLGPYLEDIDVWGE